MARPLAPRGQGRARVVNAAVELFASNGVSGTSLQDIADHLGVSKAAVYYQFQAKEAIVLAVVEPTMGQLWDVVHAAEAGPPHAAAQVAAKGLVDVMIGERQVVSALFRDPEVERILREGADFQDLITRLGGLLLGPSPDTQRRVAVSVFGSGVAQAGIDPQLLDLTDADLRAELIRLAQRLDVGADAPAPR